MSKMCTVHNPPVLNLFSVVGSPRVPVPRVCKGNPHTRKETPTIEVAGRPSLIPVMCPHGPLPGLFGFWGRVLQQRKPTPRSGDSQSSRKCAHAQGHT